MTWREKAVIRILLLVAGIVAPADAALRREIAALSTHLLHSRGSEADG